MTSKNTSAFAIFAVASCITMGCGLFTINGKTLGGKKTAAPGANGGAGDAPPGTTAATGNRDSKGGASSGGSSNSAELSRVIDAGNAANEAIFEAVKSDSVPAAELAAIESAAADSARLGDAKSAEFYGARVHTYRFIQAMLALDGGDEGPLSELMAGKVERSGVSGKQFKASLKLERDRCYKIALKWKAPTGTEDLRDYEWKAAKPEAIQRYFTRSTHPFLPWSFGMCATADTTATFTAEFAASGSKPRLQYAVVSWPRDEVPADELLHASVVLPDKCSSTAWKSLWLDPIPGTIAFEGNEPYLLTSVSPGSSQLSGHNATGRERGGQAKRFADAPEAKARITAQFGMPRCSAASRAASSVSKKAAKCHEAIDRKYNRLFDDAERVRDSAVTVGALRAAESKLGRLRDAEGKARRSQCGSVDAKLRADVEKAFNEIVDSYADGKLPPAGNRMKRLNAK